MNLNQKEYTEKELLLKLTSFCAYQERSTFEAQQKLKELGATSEISKQIIIELKELNYLDEARFAMSFARGKHRIKNWGKMRIQTELQFKHRIQSHLIDLALDALDENDAYKETLTQLAQNKFDKLESAQQGFEKVVNFLYAKGYDLNEVLEVMNKIRNEKKISLKE